MKLTIAKKYVPKWQGNRDQPADEQGWVKLTQIHPMAATRMQQLQDVATMDQDTAMKASLEMAKLYREHLVAVGGWTRTGDDEQEQPVGTVSDFLSFADSALFSEIWGHMINPVDEQELKNLPAPSSGT